MVISKVQPYDLFGFYVIFLMTGFLMTGFL